MWRSTCRHTGTRRSVSRMSACWGNRSGLSSSASQSLRVEGTRCECCQSAPWMLGVEAAGPCRPSDSQRVIKQASHSNSSVELLLSEAIYKLGPFWWSPGVLYSLHISSVLPGDSTLSLSSVLLHGTELPPNGLTGPHIVPLCPDFSASLPLAQAADCALAPASLCTFS